MTLRPLASAIARSGAPAWAIGGAMLLGSALAHATVIDEYSTRSVPNEVLDNSAIYMSGGTLLATMDHTLSPLQQLVFVAGKSSTVAAWGGNTLTLGGGLDIQGIAHFGSIGNEGDIQLVYGPVVVGAQAELHVDGGRVINAPGQNILGAITRQAAQTYLGAEGSLDFAGATAYVKNLQGSGKVYVGFGSSEFLTVEQGRFSGEIWGGDGLEKVSAGTLELSGSTAQPGRITISEGTVQLSGSGSYGSPGSAGRVVNNASLVLKGFTGGISGDISGTGSIRATEGTIVGLVGANTYSGATTIDMDSQIIVAGDARAIPGAADALGTSAVLNNGRLAFQRDTDTRVGNTISGLGELLHNGQGKLTLTANNSYAGETSVTNGGTLEVGDGGTSGTVGAGRIYSADGGTLVFNRSDDTVVANVIGFSKGVLVKKGGGKLTLTSSVTGFDSRVSVENGTLQLVNHFAPTMIMPGAINVAAGAELGFENSQLMLLSENLSGEGVVRKTGSARWQYSGDGTAFTGATVIEAGELLLSNGGSLGGAVTVKSGARLQGTGRVGTTDVLSGGMLVSSGYTRLRVAGDLFLRDGSTVRYYLGDPGSDAATAGTTGVTRVTGNLDLNAKLQVLDNAQPTLGYYRLFTYGGTLSGTGLALDRIPAGHSRDQFSIDTSRAGIVDLRVAPVGAAPDTLLVWNGGTGTWDGNSLQWQSEGQPNWSGAWGAQHAVFKDAPGTVSILGPQAFTGLQFVTDGWQLAQHADGGSLQTASGGSELRVLADVTATVGAPIQGAGAVTKTGGGTLVLNGVNGYTGGTRLSEGVLSVSRDDSLGDSAGAVVFSGGTLRITGDSFAQTARRLQWSAQGGAFDIASTSNRFAVSQALSGAGDLVKLGAGTLVLTGANAYGNTRVDAGTLVGNTDSIRGNLRNDAAVVFDQTANGIFAGDISGSGESTKTGAGMLTLTGHSAQNWRVAGGTLAATANAMSGNVDLGAAGSLHLDAPQSSTFTGVVSGTGALAKNGAGMLALTGDSSGFAGTTTVNQGILSVGTNGQGKLGGRVTVARDAVLQGTGTVGTTIVQSGGAIAPGNSIGTLNVAGDLTLDAGSVYRVEADPLTNNSDRIAVSGTANLGGSVVHVGPDGNLAGERTYTILTANRVNGTFASASSTFAYLDANLGYDAQAVTLRLDRKVVPVDPSTPIEPSVPTRPMRFADAAGTLNQRATANALDSLSASNPLYQYVLTLPEGAPAGVFNSLSGEAHASVTSGLSNLSGLSRNLPFKSLRTNLDAGQEPGAATAQAGGITPASALPGSKAQPAWAELVGNWQTLNGDGNASRVDQRTGGVFVGADHAVGAGWRLGGALGYTDSRIRVDANSSKADVDSYSATIYGGKAFLAGPGKINLLVGAGYTWHNVSTTRNVAVAGAQEKLTADYGASTGQLFTELGYALPVAERSQLEPFAGVAWADTRTRGFQESGGIAALSGQSNRNSLTTTTLGLRGKTAFTAGKTEGAVRAAAGWRHAFGDVESRTRLAFDGSQPFTVTGAPLARNAAFTELGVDLAVSRSATIGITYSGQYGGGNRENAGSVGMTWRY
ncbi:autotransporter domain-containing protein [Achromobacter pestifer]|uniref:Autotransporter domain-containing protein n=1 Tax=Achromobacter pestifer TaxID=1353889 RepID=A0A6S6ZVM7_9BURK|nr:autotransporter domain-containing protein [Achromobacter pestifer]CAB3638446.1 hypothetical protein LMG3431_01881 [Achromobacter pestifer]